MYNIVTRLRFPTPWIKLLNFILRKFSLFWWNSVFCILFTKPAKEIVETRFMFPDLQASYKVFEVRKGYFPSFWLECVRHERLQQPIYEPFIFILNHIYFVMLVNLIKVNKKRRSLLLFWIPFQNRKRKMTKQCSNRIPCLMSIWFLSLSYVCVIIIKDFKAEEYQLNCVSCFKRGRIHWHWLTRWIFSCMCVIPRNRNDAYHWNT